MNDYDVVKIARKINKLNDEIRDLVRSLEDHPNGAAIIQAMEDNVIQTYASAESIVHDHLIHPERWILLFGYSIERRTKEKESFVADYDEKHKYAVVGDEI